MFGYFFSAFTTDHAMMCVYETFPREREPRYLFNSNLFSSSTRTGIIRNEVAVGSASDASILSTIFPATPLIAESCL